MSQEKPVPTRFIGLDVHKHYLVAIGVSNSRFGVVSPIRTAHKPKGGLSESRWPERAKDGTADWAF